MQTLCRRCLCLFLLVPALTAAEAPPGERLRQLILADEESGTIAPSRWPDLSPDALRNRESSDRAMLAKLHAINREQLNLKERTAWDLFEWRQNRRLEQFRLGLYVTPFWNDDRYVLESPLLVIVPRYQISSPGRFETFPEHVHQLISLLRQGIERRMLPSAEFVRLFGCPSPGNTRSWPEAAQAAAKE